MTYHQVFDRLGNPVVRRTKQPIGHTIIQLAGAAVSVVLLCLLIWGPK
jgi:hypothetical protein